MDPREDTQSVANALRRVYRANSDIEDWLREHGRKYPGEHGYDPWIRTYQIWLDELDEAVRLLRVLTQELRCEYEPFNQTDEERWIEQAAESDSEDDSE